MGCCWNLLRASSLHPNLFLDSRLIQADSDPLRPIITSTLTRNPHFSLLLDLGIPYEGLDCIHEFAFFGIQLKQVVALFDQFGGPDFIKPRQVTVQDCDSLWIELLDLILLQMSLHTVQTASDFLDIG